MSIEGKKKFEFVTLCKFVAILVVFGHYHGGGYRSESYLLIKGYLAPFQMPLFVALSGFLFFANPSKLGYWGLVKNKIESILVPYFSIYLTFFVVKLAGGVLFSFSKPATWGDLYYVFLEPKAGFESFLWFFYVLFMFFVVTPLVLRFSFGFVLMGVMSLFLYFLPLPGIFSLDLFGEYYIWFWLGGVLSRYHERLPLSWWLLMIFGVLYFCIILFGSGTEFHRPAMLLSGLLGSIVVVSSCKKMEVWNNPVKSVFSYLGENSYSIYIWHNSLVMPPLMFAYKKVFGVRSEFDFYAGLIVSLVACALLSPLISRIIGMNPLARRLYIGKR